MDKKEVIKTLKELNSKLKPRKYLTLKEIRTVPKLDYYIQYHFRGLAKALKAANLPTSKLAAAMDIKNEELLNYLRDLKKRHGRNPKVWDFSDDKDLYKKYSDYKISWSIYKTRFGGLRKAIELIGSKESGVKQSSDSKERDTKESKNFWEKRRFWGQAAEIHVMAELLYRGFQAANIPVDVGLDILAVKDNKTYYFQVKHKDMDNNQAVKITRSSFKRTAGGNVYYIFVLLSDNKRDFIIVPYHIVNDWVREGIAVESGSGYLLHIKKDKNEYRLKNKKLNYYLNSWDLIK